MTAATDLTAEQAARRFMSSAWEGTDERLLAEAFLKLTPAACRRCGLPFGGIAHGPGMCGSAK